MHLEKRGFVIFLQWPTFWDFNESAFRYYGGFFSIRF